MEWKFLLHTCWSNHSVLSDFARRTQSILAFFFYTGEILSISANATRTTLILSNFAPRENSANSRFFLPGEILQISANAMGITPIPAKFDPTEKSSHFSRLKTSLLWLYFHGESFQILASHPLVCPKSFTSVPIRSPTFVSASGISNIYLAFPIFFSILVARL